MARNGRNPSRQGVLESYFKGLKDHEQSQEAINLPNDSDEPAISCLSDSDEDALHHTPGLEMGSASPSSSSQPSLDTPSEESDFGSDWVKSNWPQFDGPCTGFDFNDRVMVHLESTLIPEQKEGDAYKLPLEIRTHYRDVETGPGGEYIPLNVRPGEMTTERTLRRRVPVKAPPKPTIGLRRTVSAPAAVTRYTFDPNDNWDDCSDVSSLDDILYDIPDDVSDLTAISDLDEEARAERTGGPRFISHLPRAEAEAFKTFELLPENALRVKSAGRMRGPNLPRYCFCGTRGLPGAPVCDESCVNRSCKYECRPNECFASDRCQNQRLQRKEFADLEVVATKRKGFGIRAGGNIPEGSFVCEYVGEIISDRNLESRVKKYSGRKYKNHLYIMQLQSGEYIDATEKGGVARFVNHSCNPNCEVEQWVVDDRLCMVLVALRDILQGEELSFKYNMDFLGDSKVQRCFCRAKNCAGAIGVQAKPKNQTVARSMSPKLECPKTRVERPAKKPRSDGQQPPTPRRVSARQRGV